MDNWNQVSGYGWEHPSGWAIALMNVLGEPGYMLSRESSIHGPFDSLSDAKARHAILVPSFDQAEVDSAELMGEVSD
ncbi:MULTISPECIES: hypothetical protein [Pseudomonadota]|uniref:Uncharacterized protein n=1 Tax=Ralstonia pickettii TaxID=329 RepID=A0AAW4QAA8_RALPI|nr:hypothetical protein [Ralstonia pickettii]MBA9846818.1 hypothetical protein [Ralstonia pickettii]MBA9852030.1 hypothetical protein [Ralstonia pickettii]MBA9919955.1 hypothetical protein [Ralstonia pickettii]MBA9959057.1 hypothetical protein [Ralstonia pickettii]MBA9964565.1 hypothetical protein [Ralstonia pickettii]